MSQKRPAYIGGPGSRVHFKNCDFVNYDTGVVANNASVTMENSNLDDDGEIGVNASRNSMIDISNSSISNHSRFGISSTNSDLLLDDNRISNNNIGVDLRGGSRGDIINSTITGNTTADIRYDRNVLIGIFDTAAFHLLNWASSTGGIERIDGQWMANRLIDTTDLRMKAEWVIRIGRRFGRWVLSGAAFELALQMLGA